MIENRRVRLTTNLTKYHPSLVEGVIGVVVEPPTTPLAQRTPHVFMTVRFPEHTLDMLHKGLVGIDTHVDEWDLLRRTCTRAVQTTGPRGGFQALTVDSLWSDGVPKRQVFTSREPAEQMVAFLHGETAIRVETMPADTVSEETP